MFNEMYRVLVKNGKRFVGTGNDNGDITIEHNKIHQSFYEKSEAENLSETLQKAGFETKVVKG